MPGPDWQKFANLRLLYSYMMCHPGKKLLFMGAEVGQWNEWDCKGQLDWYLLQYPLHQGLSRLIADLNHFYQGHPALWEIDFDWTGYEWIDFSDAAHSVISYLRKSEHHCLACVHNFTPEFHPNYRVPLANAKKVKEVFNTDAALYGGSNQLNESVTLSEEGFTMALAPLATHIFEIHFA